MKAILKTTVLALAGASLLAGATAADAGTWQNRHPRRAEVNGRLANQNRRITQERRDGQITRGQAHDLRAEDRGIRAQERFDASHDGGHITKGEQAQLNREENGVSRQIGN
jgi:hypothetical protein